LNNLFDIASAGRWGITLPRNGHGKIVFTWCVCCGLHNFFRLHKIKYMAYIIMCPIVLEFNFVYGCSATRGTGTIKYLFLKMLNRVNVYLYVVWALRTSPPPTNWICTCSWLDPEFPTTLNNKSQSIIENYRKRETKDFDLNTLTRFVLRKNNSQACPNLNFGRYLPNFLVPLLRFSPNSSSNVIEYYYINIWVLI